MPFSGSKADVQGQPDAEAAASPATHAIEGTREIEETIAKCRRGESEGQRDLFERFHRRVFRLAARLVGDVDAADITQDVFLRVFQRIDQFRGESRFDTWLHRITVNECFQFLRRQSKRQNQRYANEPAEERSLPADQIAHRELMETALRRLDPELRAIFLLREVEELNYSEIAEAMQIPEGTVASRLNRARRQLREILVELGWE